LPIKSATAKSGISFSTSISVTTFARGGACRTKRPGLEGNVFFAGDPMGLSRALFSKEKIDQDYLLNIFLHGSHDFDLLPNKNIFKLKPGHYLLISPERAEHEPYWFPEKIQLNNRLNWLQAKRELNQLLNDEKPTINGDGKQSRDFTYIENVIEANLKACKASSEVAGEAFNIAYGGREYLIDVYYSLCKALRKDIEPIFGPDRKGDIKHSNADISKAKEKLGYDPIWSFERGIEAAIEWYRENLKDL